MEITATSKPRPWFISLTAIWRDADGYQKLRRRLESETEYRPASHHVRVRRSSWHSTVFALAELGPGANANQSASERGAKLLKELATTELCSALSRLAPFDVVADELSCYDSGTAVQFSSDSDLGAMRDCIRKVVKEPVECLLGSPPFATDGIESLCDDQKKSAGPHFYGSIARSPCTLDDSSLRWKRPLSPTVPLHFDRLHLLVSDQALTNPLIRSKTDVLIRLGQR